MIIFTIGKSKIPLCGYTNDFVEALFYMEYGEIGWIDEETQIGGYIKIDQDQKKIGSNPLTR